MQDRILDLAGCGSIPELHERIRQCFGFPAHYGANLDALWDMGRDYLGSADGAPEQVIIRGADTLPPELHAYFLEKAMRVLRDLERARPGLRFLPEK